MRRGYIVLPIVFERGFSLRRTVSHLFPWQVSSEMLTDPGIDCVNESHEMAEFYQDIENVCGFTVQSVLTPNECSRVISDATFLRSGIQQIFAGNRQRAVLIDEELADVIWNRIATFIKPMQFDANKSHSFTGPCSTVPSGKYVAVGLNPMLRVSKYIPGCDFGPHYDSCYARDENYVGMHTILIYLNENIQGGCTRVFDSTCIKSVDVKPEVGKALVFFHHTLHAGMRVNEGVKYVIRTEVMFKKI